jgi:WD40 repeat protein
VGGGRGRTALPAWDVGSDLTQAIAFSPDGTRLAICRINAQERGKGYKPVVALLDSATGKPVREIKWTGYPLNGLAYSPDGARLVGTGGPYVRVWDTASGKAIARLEAPKKQRSTTHMRKPRYSPGGKWLAAVYDVWVHFWDAKTLRHASTYNWMVGSLQSVDFTPDGLTAVTVGRNTGTVVVWDVEG